MYTYTIIYLNVLLFTYSLMYYKLINIYVFVVFEFKTVTVIFRIVLLKCMGFYFLENIIGCIKNASMFSCLL